MDDSANQPVRTTNGRVRRTALGTAALAGGAFALSPGTAAADDSAPSDVDILNYALALEHLEAAYYNEFLDSHSESDVEGSAIARYFAQPSLRYSLYQQIEDVRDHEEAHVDALSHTIEKLGGTPVEADDYEFPYDSIDGFVALADRIEAVGVSAYAGSAPLIDDDAVFEAALSIHSVEANHSTFFNVLHLQRAAPNAFNPARDMDQVLPIAKQFSAGADTNDENAGEGHLSIAGLSADADGNDNNNLNDEYIVYENTGNGPLDLSGWTVTDSSGTTYTFPAGFSLTPGAQVTLYTGSGTDTDSKLYWGRAEQVWNNTTDAMTVENAAGETVLQRSYP